MMIARVSKTFRHVNTGITWQAGDVFEGTEEQACELARRGFVQFEAVPEPASADENGEPDPAAEDSLDDMTVAELKALCDGYGISYPAKAKKANLAAAVRLYRAESGSDEPEGE